MNTKKAHNPISAIAKRIIAMVFIGLIVITAIMTSTANSAYAATTDVQSAYEARNVLDDLDGSTIGGEEFSLDTFGWDKSKKTQVISFVEYCYSYYTTKTDDYALYVYVYNPQCEDYVYDSVLNEITIACLESSDDKNIHYYSYSLKYLNMSTKAGYEGLFFKYKVELTALEKERILNSVKTASRVYKIGEIELLIKGETNAQSYAVGSIYTYSGFAEGYGNSYAVSDTLSCTVDDFSEILSLDLSHTYYRTSTSSLGVGHQVQLDTVYFSVPESIFEEYGTLQRIKAEWYEYKTKPIVVVNTSSSTYGKGFYDYAKEYIGQSVTASSELLGSKNYGIGVDVELNGLDIPGATKWGWNVMYPKWDEWTTNTIYYLFETSQSIEEYDPYAEIVSTGGVESNVLYNYILSYNKSYESGTVKNGMVSADLFESDIDTNRKLDNEYGKIQYGYSYYDFDVDTDLQELQTFNPSTASWKDKVSMYGFWGTLFNNYEVEESKTLPPIQILTDSDITGTSESKLKTISDTLCVNYNDVTRLQNYYAQAKAKNEKVVLFRFATSDYYSEMADLVYYDTTSNFNISQPRLEKNSAAYVAQESVFLDFDIIDVTFTKNGVETIIPVAMSPIDIVDDVSSPAIIEDDYDWLEELMKLISILIVVVVAVVVIVILSPILSPILTAIGKGILWFISYPFKLIGSLFKKE